MVIPGRLEPKRSIVLIDGENLVARFQELSKTWKANDEVVHIENTFVWHPYMAKCADLPGIVRVSYYTSVRGDYPTVDELKERIFKISYYGARHGFRIAPHVFKKDANTKKSKLVDLSLAIDALRHAYHDHIDQLYLFSGDGDYVPLVQEVMRAGKRVIVGAFSSGLSSELARSGDAFIDLDKQVFLPEPAPSK